MEVNPHSAAVQPPVGADAVSAFIRISAVEEALDHAVGKLASATRPNAVMFAPVR